jgi:hypothetical protein
MRAKPKRPAVKGRHAVKNSRVGKAKPLHANTARRAQRSGASTDRFVLNAVIAALEGRGYTRTAARQRAKELLAAPGFAGFPSADAFEKD